MNHQFIRALRRETVDRTPVWIMRQAGRYLPEYRATREKAGSFMQLCKTPELACEVTLQPLARFDLDAAILFSDILTIPDAMGLDLNFVENEGPVFGKPIKTIEDIRQLHVPTPREELNYVMDAVQLIKASLENRVPLIGFAGSPWTLAAYMIEGRSSSTFSKAKAFRFQEPQALHQLLDTLAQATSLYLQAQIDAGVDVVMLFDTWGGLLTTPDYQEFSLHYMQRIIQSLKQNPRYASTPTILFTKGGNLWLEQIAQSGCDALGVDWTIPIGQARERVQGKVAIQGNLDPTTLYAPPTVIRQHVKALLEDYGPYPGHIFNLGHGIYPDMPYEHVKVLVDAVHEYSS